MLMDEDWSENKQVKVATWLFSQAFSCWPNQRATKDSSLFVKGKNGKEGKKGAGKEGNGVDSEEKKKETEDGEQERETPRGAGEQEAKL